MKNRVNDLFSSRFSLTSIMLIIVFIFRFFPDKVKAYIMCLTGIAMLLMTIRYKRAGKPTWHVILFIQLGILMFVFAFLYVLKGNYNNLYLIYGQYIMLIGGLIFLLILGTMFIMVMKTRERKKITQAILACMLFLIPLILFLVMIIAKISGKE